MPATDSQPAAVAAPRGSSPTPTAEPAKRSRLRLGRTFSITIGAKDLGNLSAGLAGGVLLAATGGDFRVLWLVVIALAVVPLPVAAWVPPDAAMDDAGDVPARAATQPAAPARLWGDRRLRAIALLGLFAGTTAHMTHGLFQVYAVQVGGLNAGQVGLIYSAAIATLLVLGPAAGYAADRFGTDRLAGARGLANAVSSVVYLVAPSFAGLLAGRLVDEAGKAAFRPTWGALLATAARTDARRGGKIAAGLDTALSLGEALGPILAGLLWQWWGVAAFLLVRAALGLGVELLLGRRLRATATSARP